MKVNRISPEVQYYKGHLQEATGDKNENGHICHSLFQQIYSASIFTFQRLLKHSVSYIQLSKQGVRMPPWTLLSLGGPCRNPPGLLLRASLLGPISGLWGHRIWCRSAVCFQGSGGGRSGTYTEHWACIAHFIKTWLVATHLIWRWESCGYLLSILQEFISF